MSELIVTCVVVALGLAGGLVAALAPLRYRTATAAAMIAVPALGYAALRLSAWLPPMGATDDGRDPVEAFDLWLAATALALVLVAALCFLRLVVLVARRLVATPHPRLIGRPASAGVR